MILYRNGRLHFQQVSVEMPNNVLIDNDTCSDRLFFRSVDGSWRIILEESQNKISEGIWGDWLEETDIYEGPDQITRAGITGEQAVWGGTHDLYYEVRFPLSIKEGYLNMIVLTLHIPHFSTADIRKIKEHPVMNHTLNSLRMEEDGQVDRNE